MSSDLLSFGQSFFDSRGGNSEFLSNNIYSIRNLDDTYLWICTDAGLTKYGGIEKEQFDLSSGLSDLEIFDIYKDRNNRYWLKTLNGSLCYLKIDSTGTARINKSFKFQFSSFISSITEDNNYTYISSMQGGLVKIDDNDNSEVLMKGTKAKQVFGIHRHGEDTYIISSSGIYRNKIDTNYQIAEFRSRSYLRSLKYESQLYISNDTELYKYDLEKDSLTKSFFFTDSEIISIENIDSEIWVGCRKGLYQLNEKGDLIDFHLTNLSVSGICRDFEGGYWASTLQDGLYYCSNLAIKHEFSAELDISQSVFFKGEYFIATRDNQLYKYSKGNLSLDSFSDKENITIKSFKIMSDSLNILSGYGIKRITPKDVKYSGLPANDIIVYNSYYFLGGNALFRANKTYYESTFGNTHKPYDTNFDSENLILNSRITVLRVINNKLYAGGNNGLFVVDEYWNIRPIKFQGRDIMGVTNICDLNKDEQLIFTKGYGIYHLKGETVLNHWQYETPLMCDKCLSYNSTVLFINQGLVYEIRRKNGRFSLLNKSLHLGLDGIEVFDLLDVKGDLKLMTNKGGIHVPTTSNNVEFPRTEIFLEQITSGKKLLSQSEFDKASFSNANNSFDITVNALIFKEARSAYFRYRLKPLNKHWNQVEGRNISLNALPPNTYTLEIQLYSDAGKVLAQKTVNFEVEKAFYQKTWFIILSIMLSLGFVSFAWWRTLIRLKKRHQQEQQILEGEKEKFELQKNLKTIEDLALRLQMNPHFIFNALNTIKGYYSSQNIQKANTYISKFSKLLRIILENKDGYTSIQKEIDLMQLYVDLARLRIENNFDFNIRTAEDIDPEILQIPSMLLQPILENALIHGISGKEEGQISVIFSIEKPTIVIKIQDDGKGFESSERKINPEKVNALNIVRQRLDLIQTQTGVKCEFSISSTPGKGTTVILKTPIQEKW